MTRALITGINGQDGSYLAELLLSVGYEVHGIIRRTSHPNLARLAPIRDRLRLHWGDLADGSSLARIVTEVMPDEVYNLGAQSDVKVSYDVAEYSGDVTGLGSLRLLELLRGIRPEARFYQAGSSEMFGLNPDVPTNETSAFHPASPYAAAKVFAHHMTVNYRESYGMFCVSGILFNHESPRRGDGFVTRKITRAIASIRAGRTDRIALGSLDRRRDWGFAKDYVRAMYLMMQADVPTDFVIATGESHSVAEFCAIAFDRVGMDWEGYVEYDPSLIRPLDPPVLLGDASKAQHELGWKPEVGFTELVEMMVDADLER